MPRNRGRYDPSKTEPYELSRSKVEMYVRCPACFWLDRVAGIQFPSMPGFNLNTNTDTLLKRDFDSCRGEKPHPLMVQNNLSHLIPFQHDNIEKWMNALHFGVSDEYFSFVHKKTNIRFGGGVDDVWIDQQKQLLHIVDYKSTAQLGNNPSPVTLNGEWMGSFKRQMDMYQWIMRQKDFVVSDVGYFVYVDGQHIGIEGMISADDPGVAWMKFNTTILPYEGNVEWVENVLFDIKETLETSVCPDHPAGCEYGRFLGSATNYLDK